MLDCHTHTSLSYCADNDLTLDFYAELIKSNEELDAVVITDHGMALYFPEDVAWKWEYISDSSIFDTFKSEGNRKVEDYLDALHERKCDGIFSGIEVEMMNDGRFTLDPIFRDSFDVVIGSVHSLPVSRDNGNSPSEVLEFWREHTLAILDGDVDIIGHPFRWLASQMLVPEETLPWLVARAKERNVALELNSHFFIDTDVAMIRMAAECSVSVAFASDAHSRVQAGDFSYHFGVLESAGVGLSDLKLFAID